MSSILVMYKMSRVLNSSWELQADDQTAAQMSMQAVTSCIPAALVVRLQAASVLMCVYTSVIPCMLLSMKKQA